MIARCAVVVLACMVFPAMAASSANRYFQAVDTDQDGRISPAEYIERMTWACHQLDANHDGVLEPGEQLAPGAPRTTIAEVHERLQAQFKRQDRNHDGQLAPAEFLAPPA